MILAEPTGQQLYTLLRHTSLLYSSFVTFLWDCFRSPLTPLNINCFVGGNFFHVATMCYISLTHFLWACPQVLSQKCWRGGFRVNFGV